MIEKEFCTLVGNLIAVYLDGKITELDLYNSILRLVYNGNTSIKGSLQNTIKFLDDIEDKSDLEKLEIYKNILSVEETTGEDYIHGIERIAFALSKGNK